MEGPSLVLASEQLQPFAGKRILAVRGNTTIGKERCDHHVVTEIFSWGKHLVLQFEDFALRVHFMLFGTYEAEVAGHMVSGDYRRAHVPRLALKFANGELLLFNCSLRYVEGAHVKRTYDFSVDVLSRRWDAQQALGAMREHRQEEVSDVLLDQNIFAGVGNIIKNEVLSLTRVRPDARVADLSIAKRKEIIAEARAYSFRFLRWRRAFELRKHLLVHQRSTCPHCGGKLVHRHTGKRKRTAHYCPRCQHLHAR